MHFESGSTGESHNTSCSRHISYYVVASSDIKKRRTFTPGGTVIISKRVLRRCCSAIDKGRLSDRNINTKFSEELASTLAIYLPYLHGCWHLVITQIIDMFVSITLCNTICVLSLTLIGWISCWYRQQFPL